MFRATSHGQHGHNVDSVLAPGEQGWGWMRLALHTLGGRGFTPNLTAPGQGPSDDSGSHPAWPLWGTWTPRSPQMPRGRPSVLGASVPRGSLMVRVGGGWVALDEYLVKNDPGRAKGRTSQKIHERFLSWAVVPSRPAPKVTSPILRAPSCLLPRKTGLGACWGHRDPSSSRSRPRKGTRKGTAQDSLARPTQD
ncbi:microtubule-actin cross-linking factor 1-like isoform X1 [Phyllostomus discolor]|uniref:Microtubule-actin cross-linking factor 1-like isoform X1 n=1 Tax=Phyllostomus discolor TaxID=89673 RepID=A0A7E6E9A5_9CHIR|nr:microtubule-actin cross-linking factor 1-like isoform X1 [Phyllostomus discolor]